MFPELRKIYIGPIFDQILFMTFLSRVTLHVAFRRMPQLEDKIHPICEQSSDYDTLDVSDDEDC